jgi:hypothetical protein
VVAACSALAHTACGPARPALQRSPLMASSVMHTLESEEHAARSGSRMYKHEQKRAIASISMLLVVRKH